jgi:histidinol dehydrogenase
MSDARREADDALQRRVAGLLAEVRDGGDAALRRLTLRFDRVRRGRLEVSAAERRAASAAVPAATRAALRAAARCIAAFARLQKGSLRPLHHSAGGVVLEQRLLPVETVGVYAPGGRYPLCSCVLMGAIPARIAGCHSVILCTPPRRDGRVAPEILEAARIAGVDRIFAVGGAQAIAALAYGTRSVPRVDLIVGPGNRYVAAAKAQLAAQVGIDFVAGPSELLVIADATADRDLAAADLLAQAEHDPGARLWLVAIGGGVAPAITQRAAELARALPAPNRQVATRALARLRPITCASAAEACRAANRIAPEHLSLPIARPRRLLPRLTAYGSLFLGPHAAVALGDYVTGPNHTLPTAGAARHTGGLSVLRFLRVVTVQQVSPAAARRLAPVAERLAALEGLVAHRASVAARVRRHTAPAVLFDYDGVLVDSEEQHFRAFRDTLGPLGIELARRRYDARYLAFDDRGALRAMLRDAGRRGALPPLDALLRRKRAIFRSRFGRAVRVDQPIARLLRELARRVPIAVVSGAARAEIAAALRRGGLAKTFRTVVAAEDVSRCKPDPEGYLLALRRLGFTGADGCMAVEDSPGGIRAARAAGLRVLGVASSYPAAALRRAGAARVVPSIATLTPEEILS